MFTQLLQITNRIQSILLAILFASIGNSILIITLPLSMAANNVATNIIGIIMAGYSIGILAGSYLGNRIIVRVGFNRSYAAVAGLVSITACLHMFIDYIWVNLLLRFLVGFSMAVIYITLESWLNATSENDSRGTIYGMYQLSFALGIFSAPFVATLIDIQDIRSFGLVSLVMSLSLIPLTLSRFPAPQLTENQQGLPIIEMLRDTPSGAVMSIVSGLCMSSLLVMISLFAKSLEVTNFQTAIVIAITTGSSIFFQIPIGKLADKIDERTLLLIISIGILVSSLYVIFCVWFDWEWWLLGIGAFFCGGFVSCIYPVSVKFIFNQMDAERAVPAMSTMLLLTSFGLISGPILASTFMEYINPAALFLFLALLMIPVIPFLIFRIIKASDPAEDSENVPYMISVHMLRPTSANLDPRTDYLITKVNNKGLQALAKAIAISPAKTHQLILSQLEFLEGFREEEILEGLVMLKPRLSKVIVRAMLLIYPDKHLDFTHALKDLISLDKRAINRLVFIGLTHMAEQETVQQIEQLFNEFLTPKESEVSESETSSETYFDMSSEAVAEVPEVSEINATTDLETEANAQTTPEVASTAETSDVPQPVDDNSEEENTNKEN